ncbi:unnamed protein product [Arctia plantaginis]|uniref:C2H2-type domain-containing protein n=1 Tax=Arctia plantaginis TaxID=874455 RepID=A0A8S0ZUG9_ARCPL|nr:unnamed protein product [Arctia plantaginis]
MALVAHIEFCYPLIEGTIKRTFFIHFDLRQVESNDHSVLFRRHYLQRSTKNLRSIIMDMIEVDPKLFVTCRLCLKDLGQYQIVPIVQQQIKYCYDIDVEPFDGLPQLICMKCKEVLSNFFTVKKNLCDKQSDLRSRIPKKESAAILKIQPQQDTVSSSQQTSENIEEERSSKQKIKRVISSDSESSSTVISSKKKKNTAKKPLTWDGSGFRKELVCTICNTKWPQLKSLLNHRRIHLKLKTTYPTIFNRKCSVSLKKVDEKANYTGMNNIVVHNNSKIIEYCNSLFYYVKYSKEQKELLEDSSIDNESQNSSMKNVDIESTDTEQDIGRRDTEQEIGRKVKRRKRRILSKSSNETVVIESNGNKVISDNEDSKLTVEETKPLIAEIINDQCINIDDSSDSDTVRNEIWSRYRLKPLLEAKLGDYKIIQGIITMCVNAFHRKNESIERSMSTESQLRRKVLGIGRKIINRQGFNWTGLLKFMEHKNLGIIWVTKGIHNGKDSNVIRIMTRLREDDTSDDNQGWVPVPTPDPLPDIAPNKNPDTSLSSVTEHPIDNELNIPTSLPTSMETAVIYFNNSSDPKNKLLNANPVANPKQLPRKLTSGTEFRINKVMSDLSTSYHNNEDTELCMPIITSTTSLAVSNSTPTPTEPPQNDIVLPINTNPEKPAPRIKVKPVTELMSERTLNSLREQSAIVSTTNMLQNQSDQSSIVIPQIDPTENNMNTGLTHIENTNIVLSPNVWVPQSVPNMFTSHVVRQIQSSSQPMQLVQISCVNPINVRPTLTYQNIPMAIAPPPSNNVNSKDEFVLLNTVELPNTKTNSPFNYLKNLSRIHNLILIDPDETLSRDFICLIKFKVQFKQEPIDEPVVLCLSLFCSQNKFCFTVRDRNQKDININKISPNWQWEIIKIFRGDLVDRLLQNAQKHSQETHEYTNKFLCLLKSINFQKLS